MPYSKTVIRTTEEIEKIKEKTKNRMRRYYIKNTEVVKERTKGWRAKNPEAARELLYNWRKENPDKLYAIVKRYKENNPEKERAHNAVEWAVKSGKLIKPDSCVRCDGPNPEAHHEDYNKPLDVEWICRQCHLKEHGKLLKEVS